MDWLKQSLADVEAEFNLSVSSPAKKDAIEGHDGTGFTSDGPKTSTPVMPRKTPSSSTSSSKSNSRRNTDDSDKGSDWSALLDTPKSSRNASTEKKTGEGSSNKEDRKDGSPLKAENGKLKKLLMKLKKENASLIENKEKSLSASGDTDSNVSLTALEQSLAASTAENAQLRETVEAGKQEATKLKKFSLKLKKENVELKARIATLEEQMANNPTDAQSDSRAVDVQLQELRDQIAEYVQQLEASKAQVEVLTQQCKETQAEQDTTKSTLDHERESAAQTKVNADAETARLQDEVDRLSTQLKLAQETTTHAESTPQLVEMDALTAADKQLQREKEVLEAEIATLQTALSEQTVPRPTQSSDAADDASAALSATNTALVAEIAALKKKCAELESSSGTNDDALADAQAKGSALAADASALRTEVGDLKDALASSEAGKAELQAQFEEETNTMLATVQKAQEQANELMEQVEQKTALLREAEEAAQASAGHAGKELAAVRDELVRMTAERNRLQSELSAVAETNDALESESRDAVSELAAECSTLRTQVQQLEVAKARLTTQLEQEQESHASTKERLNTASVDASNLSMLDLEIADYKRTVESLNKKLTEMAEQHEQHQAVLQEREGKIAELTSTRAREEELKGKDEQTRLKLKTLLLKTKKELTEKRSEAERLDKAHREQLDAVEAKNQEIEILKTDIAELNVQLNTIEATQREADTTKDVQLHSLKFELETARRECKQFQTQAQELQKELQNYKARAHTLLKQKTDENAPTKDTVDALQAELAAAKEALTAAQSARDEQRTQCDTLGADFDELIAKFEATDRELQLLKGSTTAQIRDLEDAHTLQEQRQMEALSELRLEHSMALRSQKDRHAQQLRDVHARLELTEAELERARAAHDDPAHPGEDRPAGGAVATPSETTATTTASAGASTAAATRPPAGVDTPTRSGPAPTPSAATESSRPVSTGAKVASAVSDLATLLVTPPAPSGGGAESGDDRLAAAQAHITHLATLLAESEGTVERMVEQSKVLKQEIRRHEKNSEREEDAKNLEYIKNVVYKFITAHEEKAQLIPVGVFLSVSNLFVCSSMSVLLPVTVCLSSLLVGVCWCSDGLCFSLSSSLSVHLHLRMCTYLCVSVSADCVAVFLCRVLQY
eukprot:m.1432170 g.1432170  ORF g.1432170 m.1432170 type:complete len:1150 (-) comp25077_c0_seq14:2850-6299(-)